MQEFQIDQTANISCVVNNVYPRPIITFIDNYVKLQEPIREEEISLRQKTSDTFSIRKTYTFTPKFTDNNKNFSCSVFSHGANSTVSKSFTLNVKGLVIRSEFCKSSHVVNLNEINYAVICEFFSNPKIEPTWETKKKMPKVDPEAVNLDNSDKSTAASEIEEIVKIPNNEDENSNYIGSIESVGNSGVYRAILRIKTITEDDFKNFTLKLTNGKTTLQHVIVLSRAPEGLLKKKLILR